MYVWILRNGDSYSSRYARNKLKPHRYHHRRPYEHRKRKRGSRPDYIFREILERDHESERTGTVEKTHDRGRTNEQRWVMLLLKRRDMYFWITLRPHRRRGIPPLPAAQRRSRRRRGRWWRRRCRITDAHFPPDNLQTFEYFPPRTKCRKALRLKRQLIQSTIPFHDIPSKFGVYLCSLGKRSHVVTSFRTARSKSSVNLLRLSSRRQAPANDLRTDPDRHAHPLSKPPSPAVPNPRPACPKPPPAAAI